MYKLLKFRFGGLLIISAALVLLAAVAGLSVKSPGDPDQSIDVNCSGAGPVVKWEQPPDPNPTGMDIRCDISDGIQRILADDFLCTTPGPINKVVLWGSWQRDIKGQIQKIHLSIHSDDPIGPGGSDPCNTYSKPDLILWQQDFNSTDFVETPYPTGSGWWWDPITGIASLNHGDHNDTWQYDITIDSNAFVQDGSVIYPKIYWLDAWVDLMPDQNNPEFGWKTSLEHWNDDAVYTDTPGIWGELRYPPEHINYPASIDLSFRIITGEEGPNNIKWIQEPDLTPTGMDIRVDDSDGVIRHIADDFLCTTTGWITDVHFWGSWKNDINGPINGIVVSIYSDDPIGPGGSDPCNQYSKPDQMLWQHQYMNGQFTETLYYDLTPGWEWWWDPYFNAPSQYGDQKVWKYDININPSTAFYQDGNSTNPKIYWLALEVWLPYQGGYEFGWKTSKNQWNDDAVFATGSLPPFAWNELRYPPGHELYPDSIDMAFAITTEEYNEPNQPLLKYFQYPDFNETGIDVDATYDISDTTPWQPQILADDFNCTMTGPITDIHIWGSWYHDEPPIGNPNNIEFTLSIHSDLPVGDPCNPFDYSIPGPRLWMRDFLPGEFSSSIVAADITEGYYVPCQPYYEPDADWTCWQYDFYIDPNNAFIQQGDPCEPVVYWLDVQARVDSQGYARFGWKTSLEHWNDDAVWAIGDEISHSQWQELRYPTGHRYEGQSIDLAFAITTEVNEPNELGKPLQPHTKWSQPPIEIDPTSAVPTYCGWDEESHNMVDPGAPIPIMKIVADDFRCIGSMPVTSIHWWGSFYDWEWWAHGTLPSVLPEKWWIGFWSNVPANSPPYNLTYSYPEKLLHSITIPANRVAFEEVGSDEYYQYHPNDICYQYNVDLEPEEFFWQDDLNDVTQDNIYWISIVAEYKDVTEPYYKWGWKTRPWHWMDDGVTFNLDFEPAVGFTLNPTIVPVNPIVDPKWGKSTDMAFELDTDPNYIKWEQLYTGIRNWPHYEDELSMAWPEPNIIGLVADDWRCVKRTLVTAIVWWGSYIGYNYEACGYEPFMPLPVKPNYFKLNMWTDVAAGVDPCMPYSHPNDVIWEYLAYDYDEVLVGYDKYPHGGPSEPVFRYSVRLPEEMWFRQPDYNEVFWLSVLAVYDSNVPNYNWGWTNHKHMFNDNAVTGGYIWGPDWWYWEPIYDQTGASEDMSFMLFTDPNKCINCADYNRDYIINFFDYADFADDWLWAGPPGGYNNSDLNCDGSVDWYDVKIFTDQWLSSCP